MPPARILTVGELLAHLQAGRSAREFESTPGVNTLGVLSLAWFGENLTAATFTRLRFEGALRLAKYLDGADAQGIDSVSVTDLAITLRALRNRFRDPVRLPVEAIEKAAMLVQADSAGQASVEEQPSETRSVPSLDARALALFIEHTEWTKKQIAQHLRCNEKSLAPRRCPKLDAALKAHRASVDPGSRRLRGSKDAEGNLEAWEED